MTNEEEFPGFGIISSVQLEGLSHPYLYPYTIKPSLVPLYNLIQQHICLVQSHLLLVLVQLLLSHPWWESGPVSLSCEYLCAEIHQQPDVFVCVYFCLCLCGAEILWHIFVPERMNCIYSVFCVFFEVWTDWQEQKHCSAASHLSSAGPARGQTTDNCADGRRVEGG